MINIENSNNQESHHNNINNPQNYEIQNINLALVEEEDDSNKKILNEFEKYTNDIKSYVISFHSNIQERKDFAINFFNRNKKNHKVYQTLIQIFENIDEDYELRFQTMTILKKIFNKKDFDSYIQVKKIIPEDDFYYEKREDLMLAEANNNNNNSTENYLKNMLPSANEKNELSLEEENELFSHFSNKNIENKFIKISKIDALSYIDQDYDNNKFKEISKKLIKEEMQKLPELENYKKMVDKHFDAISLPKNICDNVDNENEKEDNIFNNTLQHLKNLEKDFESKKNKEDENNFSNILNTGINVNEEFSEPLPHKLNDEENWKNLLNNANISLQSLNSYNFNLDLYVKYGPMVWNKYLENFEKFLNILQKEKIELDENIENLNRERKFAQVKFYFYLFLFNNSYRLMLLKIS